MVSIPPFPSHLGSGAVFEEKEEEKDVALLYFFLEVVSSLRAVTWCCLSVTEMDPILQVAVQSFPINFASGWEHSELLSQFVQSLLERYLELERYHNEPTLVSLFKSVRGKWSEQGVGKGLMRKRKGSLI